MQRGSGLMISVPISFPISRRRQPRYRQTAYSRGRLRSCPARRASVTRSGDTTGQAAVQTFGETVMKEEAAISVIAGRVKSVRVVQLPIARWYAPVTRIDRICCPSDDFVDNAAAACSPRPELCTAHWQASRYRSRFPSRGCRPSRQRAFQYAVPAVTVPLAATRDSGHNALAVFQCRDHSLRQRIGGNSGWINHLLMK